MKASAIFLAALLSLAGISAKAQNDTLPNAKKDTTNINLGNTRITIIEEKKGDNKTVTVLSDTTIFVELDSVPNGEFTPSKRKKKPANAWAGIEIGINTMLNSERNFSLTGADAPYSLNYAKSVSIGLNLYEYKLPIVKNNFYMSTGFGLEFNNFRFDDTSVKLDPKSNPLAVTYDTTRNYTKNKLALAYLNVPLLFTVATNTKKGKNAFHLSLGAMVGFKYRTHQKMVYYEDGDKNKPKTFDSFNTSPFRFTAMARMGYKKIGVYANYALNSMFLKDQGPELYPLTMGVSFLF
jgi:hypothetical protein